MTQQSNYGGRTPVSTGSSGDRFGTLIIKNGMGDIRKPSFDTNPTTVRFFPGLNPDVRTAPFEFDPWRLSRANQDYGAWRVSISAMINIGSTKDTGKTFLTHSPWDAGYDLSGNPAVMLQRAVKAAQDNRVANNWAWMLTGRVGSGEALPRPKVCELAQAAIFEHGGKVFPQPLGWLQQFPPIFFLMTPSTFKSLFREIERERPDFNGSPEDINGSYLHGDPIGLSAGSFVTFFQAGHDPRQSPQQARGAMNLDPRRAATPASRGGGEGRLEKGFDCFLSSSFGQTQANYFGEYFDYVKSRARFWSDVLHVPSNEDQVGYIVSAFPDWPCAVVHALDERYGNLLPAAYRSSGLQRLGRGQPVSPGFPVPGTLASAPLPVGGVPSYSVPSPGPSMSSPYGAPIGPSVTTAPTGSPYGAPVHAQPASGPQPSPHSTPLASPYGGVSSPYGTTPTNGVHAPPAELGAGQLTTAGPGVPVPQGDPASQSSALAAIERARAAAANYGVQPQGRLVDPRAALPGQAPPA